MYRQGVFCDWCPPKKLKYGKPRLGEPTSTQIAPDTPNLAQIYFFVLRTFWGGTSHKKTPCIKRESESAVDRAVHPFDHHWHLSPTFLKNRQTECHVHNTLYYCPISDSITKCVFQVTLFPFKLGIFFFQNKMRKSCLKNI